MFYRENGQFKTSYSADSQIFPIAQDRWAVLLLIAAAFVLVPLLGSEYMFRAILIPFLIMALTALGVNILVGYCGQISLGSAALWPWALMRPLTSLSAFPACPCWWP
jgi:branched-chain amino acid transport system permease protein